QLLAIAQGQIEVEAVTTQDAGGKRLEAILVGDTRSDRAVVVRINELDIETTISLFLVTLQNAFHLAAEVAQSFWQRFVFRHVTSERQLLLHGVEQIAAALIARQYLADGARQIVLGVA